MKETLTAREVARHWVGCDAVEGCAAEIEYFAQLHLNEAATRVITRLNSWEPETAIAQSIKATLIASLPDVIRGTK